MLKLLSKALLGLMLCVNAFGQSRPLPQVSFIYPLGSRGLNSLSERHNFLFNMLAGLNGGVNGFELGSLLNYNSASVSGFQIAGLCNINRGTLNGFQSAGLLNLNQGSKGAVLSGLGNLNLGELEGFNMAGLFNMTNNGRGASIAGLCNLSLKDFQGLQLSGILNSAQEMEGFQIGLINRSASLGNTDKPGLQVGLINIIDSSSQGYSMGLINVINNGYYAFELSSNEMLYSLLQFKMGVEKLYSFLSVGYGPFDYDNTLGLGFGLGSLYNWNQKHGIALEIGLQNLREDFQSESEHSYWSNARINYQYHITNHWSLSGGLSFNHYRSDNYNEVQFARINSGLEINSSIAPDAMQKTWIGLNLGVIAKI